jgi:IS5 family transposase
MSTIDYSTFIKFRKRLIKTLWFPRVFKTLTNWIASKTNSFFLVLDSSFVETYSRKREKGAEGNGFKKKIGFKLHQIIDFNTRLPLRQLSTGGARSDITIGHNLIRGSPKSWKVKALVADKGYDGNDFVNKVFHRWKGIRIGIPLRRTNQEKVAKKKESERNRVLKTAERDLNPELFKKRTEIERYFSRKKRVFGLGEERTRHLKNFRANCYLTSIMEILEWLTTPSLWIQLFTKLQGNILF